MSFPDAREFWNQRFSREDYLFGTEPNVFLASQSGLLVSGQRALSLADGEGRNSVWLAAQGLEVDALEISPVAVDKARALAAGRGVAPSFHTGDLREWDMGEARYDIVAAIFIQFLSPAERPAVFARIVRALRPGGHLILQGYTPKQVEFATGGPPDAANMYTAELLREWFGDWDIEHLREHESFISEGTHHHGISALIDLVATKR